MKNLTRCFGIAALVAVIGFSMIACSSGGGGGGSPANTPQTETPGDSSDFVTYLGEYSGSMFVLIIESGAARAAYTPKENDKYTLLFAGKVSTGIVKLFTTEGVLTLAPKDSPADTFTAKVSGTGIDGFTGTIKFDDGAQHSTPPATLTPPSASSNSEKSIAIIGIPAGLTGAYGGSLQDGGKVIAGYNNGNAEIISGVFFASLVTDGTQSKYTGSGSFSVVLGKEKEWYITKQKISITQAVTVIPWSDFKVWD